jgi:thiamine biosynthesis lipoprotein
VYRAALKQLTGLLLLSWTLSSCSQQDYIIEQSLLDFGTVIEITLIVDHPKTAENILLEIETRLASYRQQWHAWEDSDLTRFNAQLVQSKAVQIPQSLEPLLLLSKQYHQKTLGLFNPAMGKLIAAYGFHDRPANLESIARYRSHIPTMGDLKIEDRRARAMHPDLQIDLGGIAKGYAVGLLSDYLDQAGITDYIVNAGGDLQTSGSKRGKPWRLGIQNPFAPGAIAEIELKGRYSLFTSGNYRRSYYQGSRRVHHIINPENGSASKGQSSATVLANNPVLADVAATALMIDGWQRHRQLAQSLPVSDYLIVGEGREIILSRALADKLNLLVDWPITLVD